MNLVRVAIVLLGIAICVGSASAPGPTPKTPARLTRLNETDRPMKARSAASVKIYQTAAPQEELIEVYLITELGSNENSALETLRDSAAKLGCDALVTGGSRVEEVRAREVEKVSLSGTCIMFKVDPGTWQPPPPPPEVLDPDKPASAKYCQEGRARILAETDPRLRARLAAELPPECHGP